MIAIDPRAGCSPSRLRCATIMDCHCLYTTITQPISSVHRRGQRFAQQSGARTVKHIHTLHSSHKDTSTTRGSQHVASSAPPQRSDISTRQVSHKPSSADTAKTIVDIVAHGTLCTVGEDGVPLGTYSNYILDDRGMPVLRLRCDAVHTQNLRRSPRCSLFVQPGTLQLVVDKCVVHRMFQVCIAVWEGANMHGQADYWCR